MERSFLSWIGAKREVKDASEGVLAVDKTLARAYARPPVRTIALSPQIPSILNPTR